MTKSKQRVICLVSGGPVRSTSRSLCRPSTPAWRWRRRSRTTKTRTSPAGPDTTTPPRFKVASSPLTTMKTKLIQVKKHSTTTGRINLVVCQLSKALECRIFITKTTEVASHLIQFAIFGPDETKSRPLMYSTCIQIKSFPAVQLHPSLWARTLLYFDNESITNSRCDTQE